MWSWFRDSLTKLRRKPSEDDWQVKWEPFQLPLEDEQSQSPAESAQPEQPPAPKPTETPPPPSPAPSSSESPRLLEPAKPEEALQPLQPQSHPTSDLAEPQQSTALLPEASPATPQPPIRINASVAVISEDPAFIEAVRSSISPKTLGVFSKGRAGEAREYDLVIIGWDALPAVSRVPSIVLSLLNSSKLLAVAEPGTDALTVLFSDLVKPVRLGEKEKYDGSSDAFALLPLIERGGFLVPGCGCSTVFLNARLSPRGKFIVDYTVAELPSKKEVSKALVAVISRATTTREQSRPTLLQNSTQRTSTPLFQVGPNWVYVEDFSSIAYDVKSKSYGSTVGYTDFKIIAGWGSDSFDQTRGTYQWKIMLYYHREKMLNGYSPPTWVIEPNIVILDSLTYYYNDQRLHEAEPSGSDQDGQISVTFSIPWGTRVTYTQDISSKVYHESYISYYYSSFYGGNVRSQALWKWRLTGYDGSGQQYNMAAYTVMEAKSPLYFKVTIKANGYLYIPTLGVSDTASSGEHTVYFRALTTGLEKIGEG